MKKAQQRLYFLRQQRKFNLPQELLIQFYSAIIESILCTSITVWFSSATKSDLRRLQRVVRTAERIIGTTLPSLHELYLFFYFKFAQSDLHTHNCLYYILWFCYFVHCLFVYYSFIICVLSCWCHSVALWSFCHYNKFLVCVNIPGQ